MRNPGDGAPGERADMRKESLPGAVDERQQAPKEENQTVNFMKNVLS